jgi:CelD/BcsL family acetyltransferase involved in cellulose biosynthesis
MPEATDAGRAGLIVDLRGLEEMTPFLAAWRDLLRRSLEPNIFLDPDFALPAFAYLRPRNFKIVLVFEPDRERRLLALLPLGLPALRFGLARGPAHKQAALGLPLFDRDAAARALEAVCDRLRQLPAAPSALIFSDIPRDGPTFRLLAERASGPEAARSFGEYRRAALFPTHAKNKARKNESRLLRRLAEQGALSYRIARGAEAIGAMAEFLALEAAGWKGTSKTALAATPERAAFAATMAAAFARTERLSVEALELDGKAIAMGLMLETAGTAYFWKTAYDEGYAAFSPGVLFVRELTNRLTARPGFEKVDSCAMPDHPMIDRLWPGRIGLCDIGLAVTPGWCARLAFAGEALRRFCRRAAKSLLLHNSSGKAPIAWTWRARS